MAHSLYCDEKAQEEIQDYESAYTLLMHTAGFCTLKQATIAENVVSDDIRLSNDQELQPSDLFGTQFLLM